MTTLHRQALKELAIWLEGLSKGQGDLYPLGAFHTAALWSAIKYIDENEKPYETNTLTETKTD